MVKKKVKFANPSANYMLCAKEIVTVSMGFACKIYLYFDNKEYNAKSMLGMNAACIKDGTVVELVAEGTDEKVAIKRLEQVLSKSNLKNINIDTNGVIV